MAFYKNHYELQVGYVTDKENRKIQNMYNSCGKLE